MNDGVHVSSASDFCRECDLYLSDICSKCFEGELVAAEQVGYRKGAAAALGLMGMATAILETHWRKCVVIERHYWTSELDGGKHYDCFCPGCGVQMKGRDAGEDEGTEYEWCGSCRH